MVSSGLSLRKYLQVGVAKRHDRLVNQAIEAQVALLMGQAYRMKAENKANNFKLTKEQREGLEETAINMALESVKAILGYEVSFAYEDLKARVAACVRMSKMQWAGSGMGEVLSEDDVRKMFEAEDKKDDEDEDESFT